MSDLCVAGIERVFREEHGRAVAVLIRDFGDIQLAEEAVQDAFTEAIQRWPSAGLPPSPAGWIITTARNRATDRLRREGSRDDRHRQAADMLTPEEYDQLMAIAPSAVTALNRAVAVAEVRGLNEALAAVDRINLPDYYLYHAIRADLLRRLGRSVEAKRAYEAAIAHSANMAEKSFLQGRLQALNEA